MRRKITVYGLRFSKTTFWNRLNTGFSDPAVATVLTACGIETLKVDCLLLPYTSVATVLTACGIETGYVHIPPQRLLNCELQQYLPLAVLKLYELQVFRSVAFASCNSTYRLRY